MEQHHDGVRVPVDHLCVVRVPVLLGELLLHVALHLADHLSAVGRHAPADLDAGQLPDGRTCESVHRVGAYLQRQLSPIQHLKQRVTLYCVCGQ